jgi:hypothetical protein
MEIHNCERNFAKNVEILDHIGRTITQAIQRIILKIDGFLHCARTFHKEIP